MTKVLTGWRDLAVQASIAANTYVVSGPAQTKSAPSAVTIICMRRCCCQSDLWPRVPSLLLANKVCIPFNKRACRKGAAQSTSCMLKQQQNNKRLVQLIDLAFVTYVPSDTSDTKVEL